MANPTYRIRGIAPPDLPSDPAVRRLFYAWVVEIGLRVKDRELARGLDREGRPLRPISAATREHRRSAMSPARGPALSGPALMPARALSRTRSLLAGRATEDAAIFYWRFDPFTGDSWGKVLAIHRRKGRDVIGLSEAGVARVRQLAWERWRAWKRGEPVASSTTGSASPGIPRVGSYDMSHATFGIGASAPPAFLPGQSTGGMTWPEWRRYLMQPNPTPVAIPGRPAGHYNRVLAHVWGQRGPGETPPAKPPRPPRPGRPGFDWSKARDESLPAFAAHRADIRRRQDAFWTRLATSADMDDAELRAKYSEGLEGLLAASEPYIRVTPETLPKVLAEGRFKSQFETGTSEGYLSPGARSRVEAAAICVPPAIAADRRPIYGYAGEAGFSGYGGGGEMMVGGYGEVAIRLRRSAMRRATFTIGDSLALEEDVAASRADAPGPESLPAAGRPTASRAIVDALVNRPGEAAENLRMIQGQFSYLELQYHGGLTLADVAEVGFPESPPPGIVRALEERGIPWRVIR